MADVMSDDEWQAYMTREAARAIGGWLEARGRLHQPISALTLVELEALAMSAMEYWLVEPSEAPSLILPGFFLA